MEAFMPKFHESLASSKIRYAGFLAATMFASPALAQNSTGTIGVELTVTNACVVNDAAQSQSDLGRVGDILFDDQPGTFETTDSELVGTLGALSIRCSPGASPTLTVGPGSNDNAGVRRMASGGAVIPYRLYTNAARQDEITIGRQIALGEASASPIVVPIYARATNPGGIARAGRYTDTVQVTLAW
jgi:spore coat protein U-like protein